MSEVGEVPEESEDEFIPEPGELETLPESESIPREIELLEDEVFASATAECSSETA